jgi:predicted DNA-binding transcriptional regulator YafY
MPNYEMIGSVYRLVRLLEASKPGKRLTSKDLAEKLEISAKRVKGCIDMLRGLMFPVEYLEHEHRWHLDWQNVGTSGGEALPALPRMRKVDGANLMALLALRHAFEEVASLDAGAAVRGFLKELKDGPLSVLYSETLDLFRFRFHAARPLDGRVFEQVALAAHAHRCIRFGYHKIGMRVDQTEQRHLEPLQMVCSNGAWYVMGRDLDREKAVRTFALVRIRDVRMTDQSCQPMQPGELDGHLEGAFDMLGKTPSSQRKQIRVRFDAYGAGFVRERLWHASQVITEIPEGGVEVTMELSSFEEVEEWILTYGRYAKVLEPPEFVERMKIILRETLAQYES